MIECRGICCNNIQNENVIFPENKIVAVSGVSGSGKSTIVFDVIYAISNNTLSEIAFPKFVQYGIKLKVPKIESINKILPAFSFKQISNNNNKRSTVGTFTNISSTIRNIFAYVNSIDGDSISPNLFSPNQPYGACEKCNGIGLICKLDLDSILDYNKTIEDNPIKIFKTLTSKDYHHKLLLEVCEQKCIYKNIIIKKLPKEQLDFILFGGNIKEVNIKYRLKDKKLRNKKIRKYDGILIDLLKYQNYHNMEEILSGKYSSYFSLQECDLCKGSKLKSEVLKYKVSGLNFYEVESLSLDMLIAWIEKSKKIYSKHHAIINQLNNIKYKISSLINANLSYISLSRTIPSLSGGEYNRLRFSQAVFSNISNSLFIFDEPSSGLHPKDIINIFNIIKYILKNNNSVLIVEHNKYILNNSDYIIDVGPYAGVNGGKIIYMGDLQGLKNVKSETSNFLFNKNKLTKIEHRKLKEQIVLKNFNKNNLKIDTIKIYRNVINVIVGVSGSGKSTLLYELYKKMKSDEYKKINNIKNENIIIIDQKPIGKNSRSIVATYIEIWELIRNEFSKVKYNNNTKNANYFSFNVDGGGRCKKCNGDGVIKHNFAFLDDDYIECDECNGTRYSSEALNFLYNGNNISNILDTSIDDAIKIFKENKEIVKKLSILSNIGLGYIKLGQTSNTLSGGESQRIKLAYELIKNNYNNIYIIDEPTLGLHSYDIKKIMFLFNNLILNKNTIICADHNLEFILQSDYIIEIGPGAGQRGGKLLAFGDLDSILNDNNSIISKYLLEIDK